MRSLLFAFFSLTISFSYSQQSVPRWKQLASPDTVGIWLQPAQGTPAMPVWGHSKGIIVGLAPLPGPRGLIRIYAPYLGIEFGDVMNFIALEPIPKGSEHRGYSELEKSRLDEGKSGKRFWSSTDSEAISPLNESYPARGIVETVDGEECLTLYVFSEPFDNGANVYVRLRFFESRPYEFEITTHTYGNSVDLDYFVPTATMGNKARLRTLYLKDGQKSSLELWPDYKDIHFTSHAYFPQKDMIRDKNSAVYFIAEPNEKDYGKAVYAPGTTSNWLYWGKPATQYWIKENPDAQLNGLVSGRFTYWASKAPIPGGIAIENFELKTPFKNGDQFIFGITPLSAKQFIKQIEK
ncbi:MAG: hypothetical protein LBS52_03995 [Dysgonamonadaceae bacterium]|nr:hypothetical protein [Dysgonamonadaceae bacterium]